MKDQVRTTFLSHNNHFRFGYDDTAFSFRKNPEQVWKVTYGPCHRKPLSFYDECLRTARTIKESTVLPIHVMFSGGADSEVVLRSFVDAKIPVTAAILKYENDLNDHDIEWAVKACESLKVPFRFYQLDLLQFWNEQATEYAMQTYCISPQLLATMWLIDQISGYPVMGSGECLLVKEVPEDYVPGVSSYEKSDWKLWEKEKIAAWYRHFMLRGRDGCPGFFQYTPEIMLSYLQDPFVVKLVKDEIEGKLTTESSKLSIYQQHFPLASRPKYTGFEKVQAEDAVLRSRLRQLFPFADQKVKTSYDDLVKMLQPPTL